MQPTPSKYERLGEWAESIGWEKFFEKCDIPFTEKSIDDYRLAYDTWRTTTQFKFTSHINSKSRMMFAGQAVLQLPGPLMLSSPTSYRSFIMALE